MFLILYVDDESGLLDIGKLFLERLGGVSVDTVLSAQEAIEIIPNKKYDCIVSDYQMPGMDGLQLLSHIKKNWANLPFILFTGRGREEVVIEALNNGADFYLQKGGEPKSQFKELHHKITLAIERKEVEKQLRNSEQRLTDLIDFLPDATFAIDITGKVIAWNRAIEEMTGVCKELVMGQGDYIYSQYVFGERKPVLINLIFDDDAEITSQYPFIKREGNRLISERFVPSLYGGQGGYLWLIASPLYDSSGNITGAIESLRDISEKKKAEYELRAAFEQITAVEEELRQQFEDLAKSEHEIRNNERKLSDIIHFLPDATFVIDKDGVVIAWNNAMTDLTGVAQTEIIGTGNHSYAIPIYGERRPILIDSVLNEDKEVLKLYPSLVKKEDKLIAEIFAPALYSGKGASIWFTASPLYDSDGEIAGAIESIRDISEQKKNLDELRAAYEELAATQEDLMVQYRDLSWSERRICEDERFIRDVFASIMDGLIIIDKDFHVREINNAIREEFGNDESYIGKKCYEVFHHRNQPCDECPAIQTLKTGFPSIKKIRRGCDENARMFDVYTYPLYDSAAGKITGVIEYVRGISTPHKNPDDDPSEGPDER